MVGFNKKVLENCLLISGTDQNLSQKIAHGLGLKLAKHISDFFSDGEVHVQILEDVRGKDIFIIQSTNPPIDKHLFPVLLLADAARRGFARSVNLVVPYFGYSRQDRMAEPNTPISSKVIADILYSVHINHVVTIDLHSAQTQGFFDMTIDNLNSEKLFADYIKKHNSGKNYAIVSPDVGGAKRARKIADLASCKDIILIDKNRYAKNKSAVMNIIGCPEGKELFIVDDMIDTAGTISHAADALKQCGCRNITVMATHPVFSSDAVKNLSRDTINTIVVTNTIPLKEMTPKIEILDISKMLIENIYNVCDRGI